MDARQPVVPGRDEFDPEIARQRLADVLHALQRTSTDGHFPPNPGDRAYARGGDSFENCRYCDFNRVCPANSRRDQMLRAHSEDARLAPYFDLAQGRDGDET